MEDTNNNIYARWIAGELSPEELEQLSVSGELAELQSILETTDDLILPPYDNKQAYQEIVVKRNRSHETSRRSTFIKVAIAIAIVLTVICIFFFSQNKKSETVHQAPLGEMATIDLQDQSRITLNDGSYFSYSKTTYLHERDIQLTGEAFFEVVPGNLFKVLTATGTIEVVGTAFNVRSWEGRLTVECYEGSVRINTKTSSVLLKEQDSATLQADGQLLKGAIDNKRPMWQDGISRFDSAPIMEVFAELERQYDIKIQYEGRNKIFQGAFTQLSLDTALQEVCRPMDLSYTISKNKKSVLIK